MFGSIAPQGNWTSVEGDVFPGDVYTVGGVPWPQPDRDRMEGHFSFVITTPPTGLNGAREFCVRSTSTERPLHSCIAGALLGFSQALLACVQNGSYPRQVVNQWHTVKIPLPQGGFPAPDALPYGFANKKALMVQIRSVR